MDNASGLSRVPVALAILLVVVYGVALSSVSWPYTDLYNNLHEATRWSWPQYTRYAFSRDVEYRPLLTLATRLVYELIGLRAWFYQALVLAQFGAVLALLVWLFRPTGARRGTAAAIALACMAGLHTTRILFGFLPLNAHSAGVVLMLAAIALALDGRTRAFDWIFFPLTLVALLALESGLLIVPLVLVLWWAEAPGLRLQGVGSALAGAALYLTIRLAFGGVSAPPPIYTDSGLGFSALGQDELAAIFEHAHWLFWAYNVIATLLTVAASEPRAGVYQFIAFLLEGGAPLWSWLHVLSSIATTLLIVAGLKRYGPSSARDRLLLGGGLVLVVCGSALGYLYTRDRIGLTTGIGYVMLLYVGLATWLEQRPSSERRRRLVAVAAAALALAWSVRAGETFFQIRDMAWDFHREWTDRPDAQEAAHADDPLLASLRKAALQSTPADPRMDPAWTFSLFERRFSREGRQRRLPDTAGDTATPPLSPPFNIRWTPNVDEATRRRLESELGLAEAQPMEEDPRGRTWTYRLRDPSSERVRAILNSPGVEDTARIDLKRFQIER